jgi:hypothetical protein
MSSVTNLNNDWYNGNEYQTYAFEYTPGADGQVTWFVGPEKTWTLDGRAIGPNGNVGQRVIPLEPLAIVMNLGMAWSFAPIQPGIEKHMPAYMRFDYIRIYQDPDEVSVTCDPPGYETTEYIAKHPNAYRNVNKTTWYGCLPTSSTYVLFCWASADHSSTMCRSDAGYDWPTNTLMHGC